MTGKLNGLENVVDIFDLDMSFDHPNGTSAMISKIGNLKLSSYVLLEDVLVVPDLNVH